MKTIAVTNQKGGVGKTTTTQHVAAALGERGYRVLAIDLDPQSNLTMAAGVSIDELDRSMYQVLVTRKTELREVILPTAQGYDLAPADPNLGVADTEMVVGKMNWHLVLKRALASVGAAYDWCLLDCPPSLSALTVNALQAADRVLIPVSPEMWPVKGMQRLFISIDEARQEGNPELAVVAIVPTMVRRDKAHTEMLERMVRLFEHATVTAPIPVSAQFARAARGVTTVLQRAPRSSSADRYRELAETIETAMGTRALLTGRPAAAMVAQ